MAEVNTKEVAPNTFRIRRTLGWTYTDDGTLNSNYNPQDIVFILERYVDANADLRESEAESRFYWHDLGQFNTVEDAEKYADKIRDITKEPVVKIFA
jgi:hypothetical protein